MCCMEDYEEEEHQNDSEEEGRQPSLGRHGTGVRLMSWWFEYATVEGWRYRLRGRPGEQYIQIMTIEIA